MQARAESRRSAVAEAEAGEFEAASASAVGDSEDARLVALLEQHSARHASCADEAEQSWSRVEAVCERRVGEAQLAAEERSCAARDEVVTLAAQELYKTAAHTVEERQEDASFQEVCRSYCRDMERAAPFLETSKVARAELWRQALRLAADLEGELAIQGGLQALLREKDRTRKLLAAELDAPGESKRALATVRVALVEGKPLQAQTSSTIGYPTSSGQATDSLVYSPRRAAGDRGLA